MDANPRFSELFGYTLEEAKGKSILQLVVPQELKAEQEALYDRAIFGRASQSDTFGKRKDGAKIPLAISTSRIAINGETVGFVVTYVDISQLKEVEHALRLAMEHVEIMNEKLEVVGRLTRHDVQNKLAVVKGYVYMAKRKLPENHKSLEYLSQIDDVVKLILRIFEFAKNYEHLGKEQLSYIDVEKAVAEAAADFTDLHGVKIVNSCRGFTVLSDSLLRQLFYNLIDNSLKYGEKITQITVHWKQASKNAIELIYEDNGVGISEEDKQNLFMEGHGKGTGYGLYLIKKMMSVYGWKIQETGKLNVGARFVITIPRLNKDAKENYHINVNNSSNANPVHRE